MNSWAMCEWCERHCHTPRDSENAFSRILAVSVVVDNGADGGEGSDIEILEISTANLQRF